MQAASLASRPCSWAAAVPPPLPPAARPAAVQAARGATCVAFLPAPQRLATILKTSSPASCSSWRPQQPPRRRRLARPAARASGSAGVSDESPAAQPLALSSGEEQLPAPDSTGSDASSAAPTLSSASGSSGSYDSAGGSEGEGEGDGTVRIDLQLPRRSLLVQFSCNLCGGRSERLVNPIAWNKGMVIAQCQHCQAWHKLADAANLVEEIRYADLEEE